MNKRLDRLYRLFELKEKVSADAYKAFSMACEAYRSDKARHDQLVGYRKDYIKQLESIGTQGSTIGRLRNRIDFIHNLDDALVQLNSHLAQLAKQRSACEKRYIQAKAAQDAIDKLIERVKMAEKLKLDGIERKENDEYAQKQWYNKHFRTKLKPSSE